MTSASRLRRLTLALAAAVLLAGESTSASPPPRPDTAATAGEVAFANSGSAAAQRPFLLGLALLHDFEYARAAELFRQAQAADPTFAMAYWGEAMTYNHPIWMQQDRTAARAVLTRLAPTAEGRAAMARTPREAAWLHAVETLYGEGAKETRDELYASELARLHARFPDDVDATAFYALALLGTAHHGRDFATYMRSAALLEDVFPTHQHHPGVVHYLIHSYDDPIHAPLGMRAARLYGALAPDAPHALHMTSHIFIALGLWDEVIAANLAAERVVNARNAAKGAPPDACFHYAEWLQYAYLQERRAPEEAEVRARCQGLATGPEAAGSTRAMVSYTGMLAALAADSAALLPTLEALDTQEPTARFQLAYARALAAGQDASRLNAAVTDLHAAQSTLKQRPPGEEPGARMAEEALQSVMVEEADALALAASGHLEAAIAAVRVAAGHETATPLEFGPPAVPKPTFELLGDLELRAGRAAEAAEAYQQALARAPGRTSSLLGLQRAQHALGQSEAAAGTNATLARYVHESAGRDR